MKDYIYVIADSHEQFDYYIRDRSIERQYRFVRGHGPQDIKGIYNADVVILSEYPHMDMIRELEYQRCNVRFISLRVTRNMDQYTYSPGLKAVVKPPPLSVDKKLTVLLCD